MSTDSAELTRDQKVDIIIDELLLLDWVLATEVRYTIIEAYQVPPEREEHSRIYHLTNSELSPMTFCGKNTSLAGREYEFYFTRDLSMLKWPYHSHKYKCEICIEAYKSNRFRIEKEKIGEKPES